jgi:hypothetical protein
MKKRVPLREKSNSKRKKYLDENEISSSNIGKFHKKEKKSKFLKVDNYSIDPNIEAEEKEIRRLGKLLGVGGDRKKNANKLNKEFDVFEGMGDGFGDFLMELDDLEDMVKGKNTKSGVFADKEEVISDDDENADYIAGHLINDDEFEESDIEDEIDENFDDVVDNEILYEKDSKDEYDSENSKDEEEEENKSEVELNTYRPIEGEDIYGRSTLKDENGGVVEKYIPPSRRNASLTTIDEVF